VGLVGVVAFFLHWFTPLENRSWDWRVVTFAKPAPRSGDVRYVELDQASLDWGRKENAWSWPWPREAYAVLLKYLQRAPAKAVAYDVIFTEPSSYGVDDDQSLQDAISAYPRFVGAFQTGSAQSDLSHHHWPKSVPQPAWILHGRKLLPPDLFQTRASFPIPQVATVAKALGNTQAQPDPDSIYRRTPIVWDFDSHPVASLGLETYLVAHPQAVVTYKPNLLTIVPAPGLAARTIPLDNQGRAILHFRGTWEKSNQNTQVWRLIRSELQIEAGQKPDVDPAFFKDKYVFFGFTALGLYDLKPAPVESMYPGVAIHGTVLDNLLNGDFITPVAWGWQLAYLLLLAMATGVFIRLCRNSLQTVGVYVLFLALPVGLAFAAYPLDYWFPLALPFAVALVTLLSGTVLNYAGEGRQKKFIKGAFGQYLSPIVIDKLIQNPDLLNLGGEKRVLSIFFSDVQGFTSISEKLDPEELTALLNRYLSEVTSIIYKYGGTIDKYEGDAVIAFWNAPLDLPDHAAKAIQASLEYQNRVASMQEELLRMSKGVRVVARIGLNTGPVVIGNMGSSQRFNYTFFGDAGNLASRLEGMNKQFGTYFMVSQMTKDAAGPIPGVEFRELARVAVVGKSEPVTVYEPMETQVAEAQRAVLETFEAGRELYYKGDFEAALAKMESIAGLDPPAAHYVKKLHELIGARPSAWDGVWVATEK
jgi:adenylate cyclase